MNWVLVVLQVSVIAGGNTSLNQRYGWTTLGEFSTEKACVAASVKLAQATQNVLGVKNFQCLSKL